MSLTSVQHLCGLLTCDRPQVILLALEVMACLGRNRKTNEMELFPAHLPQMLKAFTQVRPCPNLLIQLVQPFGVKLIQLCGATPSIPPSCRHLHFEYFMTEQHVTASKAAFGIDAVVGTATVDLPDADAVPESPSSMLRILVAKHGIPQQFQFDVYVRLLLAKCLADLELRPYCISISMMALGVLSLMLTLSARRVMPLFQFTQSRPRNGSPQLFARTTTSYRK